VYGKRWIDFSKNGFKKRASMFDRELVRSILLQINEALDKIQYRSESPKNPSFFTDSPEGMEKLDSLILSLPFFKIFNKNHHNPHFYIAKKF
jgi:hypothetical protein